LLSLFIEFLPQNYRFIEFTIREFFFTLQNYVSMLICWYISRFLTEIYATLGFTLRIPALRTAGHLSVVQNRSRRFCRPEQRLRKSEKGVEREKGVGNIV
jgi:hypothetical protein